MQMSKERRMYMASLATARRQVFQTVFVLVRLPLLHNTASHVPGKMSSYHLSRLVGKQTMWFPNRSDTDQAAQSQKQARSLKLQIY